MAPGGAVPYTSPGSIADATIAASSSLHTNRRLCCARFT